MSQKPYNGEGSRADEAMAWFGNVRGLLSAGGSVEFAPRGYSMWPTIRPGKDTVCLRAVADYRVSDIVLAACDNPPLLVLHRIVRLLPDGAVLRGDSNLYQTETCTFDGIAGRVTAISRDSRDVSSSVSTRLLAMLQRFPALVRRPAVRILNLWKNGI